ncbi:MAG: arylesterase [Planctomycetota bacterium]
MDSSTPFRIRKAVRRAAPPAAPRPSVAAARPCAGLLGAGLLGLGATLAACGGSGAGSDETDPPAREIGGGYQGVDLPVYPSLDLPSDAPTVAFLGDSITAGYHLGAEHSYAAALQRSFFAEGVAFALVNAGVSGDTSTGGLRRLPGVLAQEPDVVVIALGANDGLRAQALDNLEANLRAMIEAVQGAGRAPVLLGMQAPPNYGQFAIDFQALYPRLAEEYGIAFVPEFLAGVGGDPDMNLADGIHPTVEGHVRLAENVAPVLRGVLE